VAPNRHETLASSEAARAFLLQAMNNGDLPMAQRIEAAKALLGERG
jgi:hypothetical protein